MTMTQRAKEPAASLEAEQALLGSVLIDNAVLPEIVSQIDPLELFSSANRLIYQEMIEMHRWEKPIDPVTLGVELRQKKLIKRVGGEAYLSRLTDGVPISTAPAIAEYIRILKNFALQRETIKDADELAHQIDEGAPAAEIAATTEKIRKKAEKNKPKESPERTPHYPTIPREAWYGVSDLYRVGMEKTCEASNNFHFATFITVAGCILGKSVAVGTDEDSLLYPNLFTVVVGDSGSNKDQATKRGSKMLRRIDEDVVQLPDIASIQGFIAELMDERKAMEARKLDGPMRILVRLSELAPLIVKAEQKTTKDLVPKLCEAYDCPPFLRSRTKTDPVKVENPALSILACTTPDLGNVQLSDLKRGLGSRCFFIPGARKPPDRHWQAPEQASILTVAARLRQLNTEYPLLKTEAIPFSPAAEKRLDRWYAFQANNPPTDSLMQFLGVRDIVHIYKLSLIFCALDLKHQIEDHHVVAAIVFVDWLRDCRPLIFEGHGLSPTMQAQAVVERIIQSRVEISYSDALNLFRRTGDAMLFKRIIDAEAVPGGPIEVKFIGERRPKRFLSWRG